LTLPRPLSKKLERGEKDWKAIKYFKLEKVVFNFYKNSFGIGCNSPSLPEVERGPGGESKPFIQ